MNYLWVEDQNQLQREEEKLKHAKQILLALQLDHPIPFKFFQEKYPHEQTAQERMTKSFVYHLLLGFAIAEDFVNSYFFGSALFMLIPAISAGCVHWASMIYAMLESVLFYIFDRYKLQINLEKIGIDFDQGEDWRRLIKIYEEQIQVISAINQHLAIINGTLINTEHYQGYLDYCSNMNQDLYQKHTLFSQLEKPLWIEIMEGFVFIFGAISSLTGSYFVATIILTQCCPFLVGTLWGVGIIVLFMVVGLMSHFVMQNTSMTRLLTDEDKPLDNAKEALTQFTDTYPDDLAYLKETSTKLRFFSAQPSTEEPKLACLATANTQI